ncbi:MAG: energy-coupling factor ABC transporter permease [Pseudomonadota bacterium]
MNIPADLIPNAVSASAAALFIALLCWNLAGAAWGLLRKNLLEWVFVAGCGLMGLLWLMRVEAQAGLELHFLGLMSLVLVFGWRLAFVGASVVLLMMTALGLYDWATLGVNGLVGVALPVLVAHAAQVSIYRALPKHYFIYLIVTAHFGAMLVMVAVCCTVAALMIALGVYRVDRVVNDYLVFLPMVMLSEGFINGAIMTLLTLLKPEWVRSFDDRDYIEGQ